MKPLPYELWTFQVSSVTRFSLNYTTIHNREYIMPKKSILKKHSFIVLGIKSYNIGLQLQNSLTMVNSSSFNDSEAHLEFVEYVQNLSLLRNEYLVSFEVIPLY